MTVALGLWPLAGITTIGVTPEDVQETISGAIDSGIRCFDTAFAYGYEGESDRMLKPFLASDRDRFRVIGKVGQRWNGRERVIDGSPETLIADAETSLSRIGIDHFDLLLLHCPDPNVPIERSAEAMETIRQRGLSQNVGVSNVDETRLRQFASSAPCAAVQGPFNLIQRESLQTWIKVAAELGCEVQVYWTLMKGLLAGKITRDHEFAPGDSRPNYPIFQGEARSRAHDILDVMTNLSEASGKTISQLSIGWALSQPGVTTAIVGAHRRDQIQELAKAQPLDQDTLAVIDDAWAQTR